MRALFAVTLAAAAMLSSPTTAKAETASDYGTLYLVEERETNISPWQVGAAYGFELSNPYLNVSSLNLHAVRNLNRNFGFGALFMRYFTSETSITTAVQRSLRTDEIQQTVSRPSFAMYATTQVTPLSGRLNLFNSKSLGFDLSFMLGGGMVKYEDGRTYPAVVWAASPQIMASETLGFHFTIGHELEAPFSNDFLSRLEGRVGSFVRF